MQEEVSRKEFADLAIEFPDNPLFALELARLKREASPVVNAQ